MAVPAYDRAFRRLASLTDYETMATVRYSERTYGLARIRALLDDLGRPAGSLPVLQVVGSKGKGTTTTAAAAVLGAAGHRVGSYLSPHLVHASERILLAGRPVGGRVFERAVDRVLPLALARAGGERPTFFELMTATALLVFEEAGADAVVLEAGMGGRLDATTAPRRAAVLLTNVSLEHVRMLGGTTARIAAEKAAAARRGVPFYSAVAGASRAGRVVAESCRFAGAPLRVAGRDWEVRGAATALGRSGPSTRFDLQRRGEETLEDLRIPLLGVHQAGNAALATAALLDLARRGVLAVDEAAVRRGLARTRIPGRLEVVGRRPLTVLDGAHNPASIRAGRAALAGLADPGGRLRVVFAAQGDKDVPGLLRALGKGAQIYVTALRNPRAAKPSDLVRAARREGHTATAAGLPEAALARALSEARPEDTVLVTGSLYLVGALRPGLADWEDVK